MNLDLQILIDFQQLATEVMDNNVNYYILFPALEQTFLPVAPDYHWGCPKVFGAAYLGYPNGVEVMLDSRWAMCYTFAWVRKGEHEKMLDSNISSGQTVARTSLQPMGFMDILDVLFSIYRNHFRMIWNICAVYFVLALGVNLFIDISTFLFESSSGGNITIMIGPVSDWITNIVGLFPIGAILFAGAQIYLGREITAGAAFGHVAHRFLSYLGSFLLWILVVGLLAITVIGIPFAIYFVARWGFYGQAVLIEGTSATRGLRRSSELVKGTWWRVFGIVLAILLLAFMIQTVLQFSLLFAFGFTEVVSGEGGPQEMFERMFSPKLTAWDDLVAHVIQSCINFFVSSLMLPLVPIGITLLYFDLRIRKEGFGTELHVPNETE